MTLNPGQMKLRILEDGTVRVETSDMGGVSHKSADDFLKEVARLLGGDVETKQLQGHRHAHTHDHDHDHHHSEQ